MTMQDLRLLTHETPPTGMGGKIESAAELFAAWEKSKAEANSWHSI